MKGGKKGQMCGLGEQSLPWSGQQWKDHVFTDLDWADCERGTGGQPGLDWTLFAPGMPAWDQQELKVHPRYQLDPSPAVVITTQFATSEEQPRPQKLLLLSCISGSGQFSHLPLR